MFRRIYPTVIVIIINISAIACDYPYDHNDFKLNPKKPKKKLTLSHYLLRSCCTILIKKKTVF